MAKDNFNVVTVAEPAMDRRVLMGLILGVLGVGLVIGIAFGLLHVLDRDQDGDDRELMGNSITLDLDKINAGKSIS